MITPEHSSSETAKINIALLVCDRTALFQTRGDYPILFEELFKRAAKIHPSQPIVMLESYDVYQEGKLPKNLEKYDAVIISGSKWSVNDEDDWIIKLRAFIKENWNKDNKIHKVKLIGICFGHQIIANSFGASVSSLNIEGSESEWEVGHTELAITPDGHDIFGASDSLVLHSVHKEQVLDLPEGFRKLASSPVCDIQSMARDDDIFTLQGHPELDSEYIRELSTKRVEDGTFSLEIHDHVSSTSHLPIHSDHIATRILDFILGDD